MPKMEMMFAFMNSDEKQKTIVLVAVKNNFKF
jgi:hypothetical protein